MSSGSQPSLRVFVVENHEDSLRYMQFYVESLGHRVRTARDMTEALATFDPEDCDVFMSDIGLPDGDGWELLRRATSPRACTRSR